MSKKKKGKRYMEYQNDYGSWNNGSWHPADKVHHNYTPKRGWNTGDAPKVCTNCDFLPTTDRGKYIMEHTVWKALMGLCGKLQVEWQAMLTGEVSAEGVLHITGYWIPKQEVTGSSVRNLDIIDDVVIAEKKIIAGVHSHGTMACFFSSTDVEDTNMSLVKHNIVVNNKGEYKAQSRVELPCGMAKFKEVELALTGAPEVDIVGLDNITTPKTVITFHTPVTTTKSDDTTIDGLRWCPTCDHKPEEDGGTMCKCFTDRARMLLPDFTYEFYQYAHGRVYELKDSYKYKYVTYKDGAL